MNKARKTLLEKLFAEHGQALVRFVVRIVRNTDDAEDIAQHAYLRLQKLSDEKELENPRAYLYQIANNLAVDQLRRGKLHMEYINQQLPAEEETLPGDDQADHQSPERVLAARQQLQSIYDAMDSLPLKCRQAFLLHRTRGLSYSEIAQEMNTSVSSVEKYILQALKVCRRRVDMN
ncbi:RNA polymerase sigma factor [Microbulbifer thermotolerans]|uniref:RNA polymerase sigma factor n=1 Tax=Microbulbifer thermotolerans TaxID=252514 RepID=A0AB35HYY4_MICTH|nr:RNA polymerase sigma factor [Microbulbifer thermotolerans]MCX2780058.1 RNA polymerase sigma factor [Microbulbifer thermotolerans]MCX2783535.1 RNA polymerase sigma factor [Microbulbifer thermotolerans]MCX2796267.1 RNA polymerase sigma factor [Microbulbifer thermotolerans]MCX2802084.1 RNA polymerase sigma factor [Microbulbifer thermotolerans]MCX2805482.1 RNA polymerase sigma factor [Microbulbifer thermotolerans]